MILGAMFNMQVMSVVGTLPFFSAEIRDDQKHHRFSAFPQDRLTTWNLICRDSSVTSAIISIHLQQILLN
jgi:hypothetical protein